MYSYQHSVFVEESDVAIISELSEARYLWLKFTGFMNSNFQLKSVVGLWKLGLGSK